MSGKDTNNTARSINGQGIQAGRIDNVNFHGTPTRVLLIVVLAALLLFAGLAVWLSAHSTTALTQGNPMAAETTSTTARPVAISSTSPTTSLRHVPTTTTTTTTTSRTSQVFWQGTLSLGLSAAALSFSMDHSPPVAAEVDDSDLLYWVEKGAHQLAAPAMAAWEASGTPTEDQCAERLHQYVGVQQVEVQRGTTLCFMTDRDRRGVLTVTQAPSGTSAVTLEVTVWDNP